MPPVSRGPLLVIDGNLFAHRSYHALPKTILRRGRKQAGAIVGFANTLLLGCTAKKSLARCWLRRTRSSVPTYRHEEFSNYQSGREFDHALLEQLDMLPGFGNVLLVSANFSRLIEDDAGAKERFLDA